MRLGARFDAMAVVLCFGDSRRSRLTPSPVVGSTARTGGSEASGELGADHTVISGAAGPTTVFDCRTRRSGSGRACWVPGIARPVGIW